MTTPTVLLVDDNHDSRTILSAVFRHRGYTVIEAIDGEAAMAAARQGAVGLVVTELYVPVGDVVCLAEVLKRHTDTAALPVIVVTSRVMPADRERAREAGCDVLLGKPVDLREIMRFADRLLRGAAAAPEPHSRRYPGGASAENPRPASSAPSR